MSEQTVSQPQQQGTHHFIITVQKPLPGGAGFAVADWSGWINPQPGSTRQDIYLWLKEEQARRNPELVNASVIFFDLQPNKL